MNVTIRSHHTSVDDELRSAAEKKLARLDRYLPRSGEATVEVTREDTRAAAQRVRVQVTVRSGDAILRAEERSADARTALELAVGIVSGQAQRHAKRLRDRHRRGPGELPAHAEAAARQPAAAPDEDEFDEYVAGNIVRVKRFDAKPMSHEEALAQMDLLGHDFFLFLDAATTDYAVLYKRREGGYGLLTPARG